MISEDLE